MTSNRTRHNKANKKRLNKGSNTKRLLIYLILAGIAIGFFLSKENPARRKENQDSSATERLKALPYLSWVPAENTSKSGVIKFDREKSFPGLNLYRSGDTPEAYLMDMNGNIVHTWAAKIEGNDTWSNIELLDNGDLIAFVNYEKLIRLDWNSNIVWISDNLGFHHDLSISGNGNIYALTRKIEYIPTLSLVRLTANDYLTVLDGKGKLEKRISVAKLLLDAGIPVIHEDTEADYPRDTDLKKLIGSLDDGADHSFFIRSLNRLEQFYEEITRPKDFFHTNAVVIVHDLPDDVTHGVFKAGNVLICIRNQNLIAVIDAENEKIVWNWGARELEHPHDPVLLGNGNILIFDNGYKRKYSRIIELDPVKKEIVWEYKAPHPEDFYSETRGSNQKLPNGNILIADSRNGHAFEITPAGEIVWEFYNPEIKTEGDGQQRATIFRMRRIIHTESLPLTDSQH